MTSDSEWLEQAILLAQKAASEDEVPVGALIVLENRVIGRGYNRREQNQDPLGHAEIEAIREASREVGSWRLIGASLYVTLEPCPMCLGACQQARVSRVVYGAQDSKGGALSLGYVLHQDARTNHRFEVIHQENDGCSKVLKEFFRKKRKS